MWSMNEAIKYLVSISTSRRVDERTWNGAYLLGYREPRFPVPAVPLRVVWPDTWRIVYRNINYTGYRDMIYIDDVSDPDDPVMVCAWDFYEGPNRIGKWGEYTRTY